MNTWEKVNFGEVIHFPPKIKMKKGVEYPFIPMENLDSNNKFAKPLSSKVLKGGGAKFEEGDTLFARITPCLQNGKISQAKDLNGTPGFGSTEFFVFRGIEGITDTDFIYYLSKTKFIRESAENSMVGASGRHRADAGFLKNLEIKLPPLLYQKKIASILSAYDDLIENNLKRIKLLEEKAQLTYEEWFVRIKYPGNENDKVDSETDLPEGWYMKKLKDECEIIMGQSPKSEYYNHEAKGLPFHQGVKDYGFRFPKNTTWSTSGNRTANEGSILFSVRAPVGRINVSREKIILGRGLASINHKRGFNSFVLYQLMNIFYRDNLIGEGTIYSSVTKKNVEDIKLVVPDESITKKFNAMAEKIDKAIFTLTKKKKLLEESRELLIPRLMSGMIDVDEIKYNYPKETFA